MSRTKKYTRRAFLGGAAASAAVPAAAVLAGCESSPRQAAAGSSKRSPHRRVIGENLLPGDRQWWIRQLGAPDAIIGYAGEPGVLPGDPVHLYVSTTSREFTVRAFRMGWYGGDLARKVWESGPVRGHRQRPAGFTR